MHSRKTFRSLNTLLCATQKTLVFVLLLVSCKEDSNLLDVCTDPIGTQNVTVGTNTLFCFEAGQNGCFLTTLNSTTSSFSVYPVAGKIASSIIDVGPVKCLGGVVQKPTTGYSSSVNLIAGHGYVVKLPDNTFGRCYVASSATSSGTPKIYVSWQYSF